MPKIQNFKMFINGEWVEYTSGKKIDSLNTENNEVWATVTEEDQKDASDLGNHIKYSVISLVFVRFHCASHT